MIHLLSDELSDIRNTAAILAGKISECFPISTWADMLPPILQLLDAEAFSRQPNALDGALQAMRRICEDSSAKLSCDDVNRPLDALIPKLLMLMQCPETRVRNSALACYNCLLLLLAPRSAQNSIRSRNSSFDDCNSLLSGNCDSPGASAHGASGGVQMGVNGASHPLMLHMSSFIKLLSALAGDARR